MSSTEQMKLSPALTYLAEEMFKGESGPSAVKAGYTYIGQMISHDIVPPTTPSQNPRAISSTLNLDSLYGDYAPRVYAENPSSTPYFNEDGHFRLYKDKPVSPKVIDFIRQSGRAIIPERRNDENVIVAQLTVFWMQLHNKLLSDGIATDAQQARELVIKLFQAVVVFDFMKSVLTDEVYGHYFVENKTLLNRRLVRWEHEQIPDFFRFASFRFGHSIALRRYQLDIGVTQPLRKLFLIDQRRKEEHMINWTVLFGPKARKAAMFDTRISAPMSAISLGNDKLTFNIAQLNLLAGVKVGLPSGFDFVDILLGQRNHSVIEGLGVKKVKRLSNSAYKGPVKSRLIKIEDVPLWPYLLHEAKDSENGAKLGPLGSILNAEVISDAIKRSEYSLYSDKSGFDINAVYVGLKKPQKTKLNKILQSHQKATSTWLMETLIDYLKTNIGTSDE
jgi:hypothetical protein